MSQRKSIMDKEKLIRYICGAFIFSASFFFMVFLLISFLNPGFFSLIFFCLFILGISIILTFNLTENEIKNYILNKKYGISCLLSFNFALSCISTISLLLYRQNFMFEILCQVLFVPWFIFCDWSRTIQARCVMKIIFWGKIHVHGY